MEVQKQQGRAQKRAFDNKNRSKTYVKIDASDAQAVPIFVHILTQ